MCVSVYTLYTIYADVYMYAYLSLALSFFAAFASFARELMFSATVGLKMCIYMILYTDAFLDEHIILYTHIYLYTCLSFFRVLRLSYL